MTEEQKKEALEKISEKTKEAMRLIREAQEIADAAHVDFSFDVAWGMGGWYVPAMKGMTEEEKEESEFGHDMDYSREELGIDDEEGFWLPSSMGC